MKSYYSIALFILFTLVMDVMAIVKTASLREDLSPADAAVVALTIIAVMLAYRLAQAEKRIAHLENRMEKSDSRSRKESKAEKAADKAEDAGKNPEE